MRLRIVYTGVILGLILSGCRGEKAITAHGVGTLAIGKPWETIFAPENTWGMALQDTLIAEGGFTWKAICLKSPQGWVLVEQDFSGEGFINRIRIYDPSFLLPGKRTVGTTWQSFRTWRHDWSAVLIPEYAFWDIQSRHKPYFHLLVPYRGEASLNQIPDSVRIAGIVIM